MRGALLPAAGLSIAVAFASPAAANGRFPASNQLVFSPSNDNLVVLRTTFGILPSHDYGATWRWLCEDALGLPSGSSEDPSLALCKTDALVVGLSLGLEVSPDTGCNWSVVGGPLKGQFVRDLDVRPGAPDTVLALTSTLDGDAGADGGPGYTQRIFTSTDDGAHWTATGVIDPAAVVTTIAAAPTDPERIYVSAYRPDDSPRTASIFVSKDGGKTWAEHPTPLDVTSETSVYVAAVDPNDEDLVYVRSAPSSRLFVSNDGAETFRVAFTLGDAMLGFALSEDGSKVYLGGPNAGLFVASSSDLQFQSVEEDLPEGGTRKTHVQCLATHGADLWACSDEPTGFLAGVSQDDGAHFTPKLHFLTITGPAACPPGSTSSLCTTAGDAEAAYTPFDALCADIGACYDAEPPPPLTAACNDAGACTPYVFGEGDGGIASGPTSGEGSCGCTAAGGGGTAGALAGLGLAALAAKRRRAA